MTKHITKSQTRLGNSYQVTKTQLWEHQAVAISLAAPRKTFGFLFEQGTGKTLAAITMMLMRSSRLPTTLILAPRITLINWEREIKREVPVDLHSSIAVAHGSKDRRCAILRNPDVRVIIANHDVLRTDSYELLASRSWEVLIVDESHRFKDPSAKRTKALWKLMRAIPYRYALSGTPILNNPLDIYSLLKILDEVNESYFQFRLRYFYDANQWMKGRAKYFSKWVFRPGAEEELNRVLQRCTYRVKVDDALDLPPAIYQDIVVPLEPEQGRYYREMERDFLTFLKTDLGDRPMAASLTITKTLRLQQLCSGIASYTEGQNVKTKFEVPTAKYEALSEALDNILSNPSNKVIIWSCWVDTYRRLADIVADCGSFFTSITGKDSDSQRQEAIDRFQSDPDCRVIICNPGAGGIGINLTAANYAIYFASNYNLEHYLQSMSRNRRGGSEIHKTITYIRLITKDTIEEKIYQALEQKLAIADLVLELKRNYAQV